MSSPTASRNLSARRFLRRIMTTGLLSLILVFAVRLWVVEGLFVPVRVVSGSMGDILPGPHWQPVCHECGFAFRCGFDFPLADQAVCPNCGFAGNVLRSATPKPGGRVLIDRFSLNVRDPRRWEVLVIRLPKNPPRLAVKRVVGLPGELVSIRQGNVYVDGQLVRKSLQEQRAMWLLVHDSRFRPVGKTKTSSRWQPDASGSGWTRRQGRFHFTPSSATVKAEARFSGPMDWLVYQHRPCFLGSGRGSDQSPVLDNYGYNQGLSRKLFEVTDIALSCRIQFARAGVFAVLAHNGRETFRIHWDMAAKQLQLLRGSELVARSALPEPFLNRDVWLEATVFDQQVQLALDGHVYLAYTYTSHGLPWRPTSRPLAIGARGLTLELADLRVWRDVYYTHPAGIARDWSLKKALGPNEYLLLGDNSPISIDGRHAPADGRLPISAVVGRVVPIPSPNYPDPF